MNKRVLEETRNKDADRENEQLSSLIAIEVARLMDEYAAKMPLDMDPQEELNQLLAILTTSLDNARLKLWPQGVPFTKTPRPGTWINGEPATLTLITSKHKAYMRLRTLQRNPDASAEELHQAMITSKAANRKVTKQLKRTQGRSTSSG